MDRHRLDLIKSTLLGSLKRASARSLEDDLSYKILDSGKDMYFHLLLKDESNNVKLLKVAISEVKDIASTVSHSDLRDL